MATEYIVPDDFATVAGAVALAEAEQSGGDTFVVAAGADDGKETTTTGNVNLTETTLQIGKDRITGMRFANTQIPPGATIATAKLRMFARSAAGDSINIKYQAEDADDSAALVNTSNNFSGRTMTTAAVTDTPAAWTNMAFNDSPELKTLIQEVIDRPGWASGNALSIFIHDVASASRREVEAYDHASTDPVELVITYTAGAPPRDVRVKDGTFVENIVLGSVAWTPDENLSITAFTPGSTAVLIDGSGGIDTLKLNSQKYVILRDLHAKDGTGKQIRDGGESCTLDTIQTSGGQVGVYGFRMSHIHDSHFHDHSQDGIFATTLTFTLRLERTKIHDCTQSAVNLDTRSGLSMDSCYIYACAGNGAIEILASVDNVSLDIRNCSFFGNSGADIYSPAADVKITVVNNNFRSSGTYAIDVDATFAVGTPSPIIYSEGNCYSNQGTAIARVGTTTYSTLAAWQAFTGADATSVTTDPLYTSETGGSENLALQAGAPGINAGVGSGVWKDISGTAFPDPHHPARGADGSRDVEFDTSPTLPTGQPIIDSIAITQATGAVSVSWTPSDSGNHGFLYRRLPGVTSWTFVVTGTGALADTLTVLGVYEYLVAEEKDSTGVASGFPGRPNSNVMSASYVGTADFTPLEDFRDMLSDSVPLRAFLGVDSKTAALQAIHLVAGEAEPEGLKRPLCLLYESEPASHEAVANGVYLPSGEIMAVFEREADLSGEHDSYNALRASLVDIRTDLFTAANAGGHRNVIGVSISEPVRSPPEEQTPDQSDWYQATMTIKWGV